jgi:glycosyltransferase involved in cell wall biosynthesis
MMSPAAETADTTGSASASTVRKIALVCDWCLPRFGGLELQLIDLAKGLRAAGHSVEIITATPGPDVLDGIPVRRLRGFRFPFFEFTFSLRQFRELRDALRDGAFDVVHVHCGVIAPLAYGGVRLAARSGIPTALTFHSVYDYLEPALHNLVQLTGAWRFPVAWSAVSHHVATETSRILSDTDVNVLPNGIDTSAWSTPARVRNPDELRLIAVMRLQVRKRPRDLFAILDEAQRRVGPGVRITLDIIGDGRERFFVDRLAAAAGADRVRVHGRRTREEIRAMFAESDAFLLPTRMESFGIAALEALLAGLPVIARRNTGVEDFVVHGENGLLGDSIEDLTDAVVELAQNEPLRAEIAERNREARPPFGWSDVVAATMAEYDRAARLQLELHG